MEANFESRHRAGIREGISIRSTWAGSAWQEESTFHQLSPYIGKTKSSMAAGLVAQTSVAGDRLLDPFSGCGTFAFEAWSAGRHVIANDRSPYAMVLTRAKLNPYRSLDEALADLTGLLQLAEKERLKVDLREVPAWVRAFFHSETLREAMAWTRVLHRRERWFLLACLLGILHHQRPGFLSFPSSHTVPYLRENKFPRKRFPELYGYRSVLDRLEAKVHRAFRRVPALDYDLSRECMNRGADALGLDCKVDAILSSPPYMRQLDYGRDNRLRLWFLGCDWESLDQRVTPGEAAFLRLMKRCFVTWKGLLKPNGYCVLVMGDSSSRDAKKDLPSEVARIATEEVKGYGLEHQHTEAIPNERRVRRGLTGSTSETVLLLRLKP